MDSLSALLRPEFWADLYQHGRIGETGENNLLLMMLVRLLVVVLIFIAAGVLVGLLRRIIARALGVVAGRGVGAGQRLFTLNTLLASTLSYLVYFIAIILTLFAFGVTWKGLAPLLGAASVLGLAIGFGAQKLVRDIITGLFILGEGQYDVGDWVTIGAVTGQVKEIGLRVTRLCDEQGREYTVANGDIVQVFNASRGPLRYTIDLAVARTTPLETAVPAMIKAADDALAPFGVAGGEPPCVAVVGLEAAKVTLRLVAWGPVEHRQTIEDSLRRELDRALTAAEVALV